MLFQENFVKFVKEALTAMLSLSDDYNPIISCDEDGAGCLIIKVIPYC